MNIQHQFSFFFCFLIIAVAISNVLFLTLISSSSSFSWTLLFIFTHFLMNKGCEFGTAFLHLIHLYYHVKFLYLFFIFFIRSTSFWSSTLYSLLIGHDWSAEMYRSWCRRHTVTTPERASTAHQPESRRQAFLLHNLWLDDVELAGIRFGIGCNTDAL